MSEVFEEVLPEDFMKFGGEKPSFLKIEALVTKIGGGGVDGVNYKNKLMKAAGWKYHELTTYGSKKDAAAIVFNKIRIALNETQEKDGLLAKVGAVQWPPATEE